MKPEANAVLLYAKQNITQRVKPTKPNIGTPAPKKDDGASEWVRFKSECVLLKGKRGSK
jgi:hypothetical protein